MNEANELTIKAPEFDLYEFVTLYWEGEAIKTKVVRRWLDYDDGEGRWHYELHGLKNPNHWTGWFPAIVIEHGHN
jgi:hypothetical protein